MSNFRGVFMATLNVGDLVYLPVVDPNATGTDRFLVLEGQILDIGEDTYHVRWAREGQVTAQWIPMANVHSSREGAERKALAAEEWKRKQDLDRAVGGQHAYLVKPIAPIEGVYFTGNPLRFGEPNLLYAAQVSTFGGPATVSKCLQNVAAIVQNIQALYAVLYALTFANDFAKKLIGKYIVIEQESAFRNFMRMSKLDPVNEKADFELLKAEIMRLNKEYSFDYLRDKLASHRDADMDLGAIVQAWQKLTRYSLQQYNDALQIHLNRVLARHPLELDYFKELGPLQGDVRPVKVAEWVPFDDPLIPE